MIFNVSCVSLLKNSVYFNDDSFLLVTGVGHDFYNLCADVLVKHFDTIQSICNHIFN